MSNLTEPAEDLPTLSWFDHLNATALMLVTPEFQGLKRIRRSIGYDRSKPTFSAPNPMPLAFHEIEGQQIRVARSPATNKPTVVLLCPLPQSILAFAPIWPVLAEQFNLYAIDLPGFGRSTGGKEFMTFKAQGEFFSKILNGLDIKSPHVVAPDVGMPTAIFCATQFKGSIETLLIGDGPGIDPSTNGSIINKMGFSNFWPLIIGNVGSGALVEAGNQIGYTTYVPNDIEIADFKESYRGRLKVVLEWFRLYPQSLATVDPLLEKIDVPTKIFWGGQDQILPVENAHRLVERIRGSQLQIFEGAGHYCYQDAYKEFAGMVVDWIGEQTNVK